MKRTRLWKRIGSILVVMVVTVSIPVQIRALEEEDLGQHEHQSLPKSSESMDHATHNGAQTGPADEAMKKEDGNGSSSPRHSYGGEETDLATPHHHEAAYTIGSSSAGTHQHRAPILPPAEDQAFSELNHQIAGVFVLLAGGLALLAASGNPQVSWAHYSWPLLFFLMGLFLFVRHDPESWPWGPLPLLEAIQDPQVLQHTLFTLIVFSIGVIEWLRCRGALTHPAWGLIFPVLAVSAAAMLFLHKHGEGPTADKIYLHHVTMAIAGILAMVAKVLADAKLMPATVGGYVWSALMMFIGVMLLLYTE